MSAQAQQLVADLSMTVLAFAASVAVVIAMALRWGRSWRDGRGDREAGPRPDQAGPDDDAPSPG